MINISIYIQIDAIMKFLKNYANLLYTSITEIFFSSLISSEQISNTLKTSIKIHSIVPKKKT